VTLLEEHKFCTCFQIFTCAWNVHWGYEHCNI